MLTQIRLRSTRHLQLAELLAAATETVNPIAPVLAKAREPVPGLALAQIRPAAERSSSRRAALDKILGTVAELCRPLFQPPSRPATARHTVS